MNIGGFVPALVLLLAVLGNPLAARQIPTLDLSSAQRVSGRGFTKVVGLKELRDGRVILVDEIERMVLMMDADLIGEKPIGRTGSGPGEYRVPSRLFSLVGDSTAVMDQPNRRFLVMDPNGEPIGVLPFVSGVHPPSQSDGRGRFYFEMSFSDSAAVLRWSPPIPTFDTLVVFPDPDYRRVTAMGGRPAFAPFSPQNAWAVDHEGQIALVYVDPYRVELIAADGTRRIGPEIPVDPIRVTEAHKAQWREERSGPRTQTTIQRGGGISHRTATGLPNEPTNWPDHLPPFLSDAATFSPGGCLWIQRTTPAEDPPTFDVFASDGRVIQRVRLPQGRQLIGFGERSLYAVFPNEFDEMYLERYAVDACHEH